MKKSVFSLFSLQNYFIKGERCRRCDIYLESSTYEGTLVVLSVSKSLGRGFMCISCVSNPNNSRRNYFRSRNQIMKFLKELKKRQVVEV